MKLRHIFLIIGCCSIIFSFLFYATNHGLSTLLYFGGLILSLICFISVLIKDKKRLKIYWTAIVLLLAVIHILTEKPFMKHSYKKVFAKNETILSQVNEVIISNGSINM